MDEGPSDAQILARSLAIGALGLLAMGFVIYADRAAKPADHALASLPIPEMPAVDDAPTLEPIEITDAMRRKGIHECNPPDPLGLGPYRPYRNVRHGRLTMPQKGGHTDDGGYDVLVHFHGHEPVRKTVVQVSRGVSYVGVDKGLGSGPYATAFKLPGAFPNVLKSIESALKAESGNDRAHIRHLALTAWSAGYGAVNEILKHGDDRIDAVVLLDGLHAAWKPGVKRTSDAKSASPSTIQPIFDFARRALRGEKIFVFTHSEVDPVDYPSTRQTADLLLAELSQKRTPVAPSDRPFPLTGTADSAGFHVWSYAGRDQKAHCDHIRHMARVLGEVLEREWKTPLMDRSVPPTKAPKLGSPDAGAPAVLELETEDESLPSTDDAPRAAASETPSPQRVDTGGLEPVPLTPPSTQEEEPPQK